MPRSMLAARVRTSHTLALQPTISAELHHFSVCQLWEIGWRGRHPAAAGSSVENRIAMALRAQSRKIQLFAPALERHLYADLCILPVSLYLPHVGKLRD
jgi:hypothetical protein